MNATVNVVCYTSEILSNGEHPLMLRICKDGKKKYQSEQSTAFINSTHRINQCNGIFLQNNFIFASINHTTMKSKLLLFLFISSLSLSMTSCIVTRHHTKEPHKKEVPPGLQKSYTARKLPNSRLPVTISADSATDE